MCAFAAIARCCWRPQPLQTLHMLQTPHPRLPCLPPQPPRCWAAAARGSWPPPRPVPKPLRRWARQWARPSACPPSPLDAKLELKSAGPMAACCGAARGGACWWRKLRPVFSRGTDRTHQIAFTAMCGRARRAEMCAVIDQEAERTPRNVPEREHKHSGARHDKPTQTKSPLRSGERSPCHQMRLWIMSRSRWRK